MLETLTKGFRNARLKLQGKAELSEDNIKEAVRDIRLSLLDADVDYDVMKSFLARVTEKAVGEVVNTKVKGGGGLMRAGPGDHFVRICHDELVSLMGPVDTSLADAESGPTIIMMVGLQGSGKTTTAGKLARYLKNQGRKPMMVAADTYRPAAADQLMVLGRKLQLPVFYLRGMKPQQLCKLGVAQAKSVGRDVVILDTAGRLAIDDELMRELEDIKGLTSPHNILYVCDAMVGQDAVRTARAFDERLGLTGFILTKLDGDARGGAALSIKEVTGVPVKFLGMGEGLDKLEEFRPEGLASRILGMGDIVGLMNDFQKVVDEKKAEEDAKKMLKGQFNFDDFLDQLRMIKKMGSLQDIFEKMPMFGDMVPEGTKVDDKELVRVEAMIQSMTSQERINPDVLRKQKGRLQRIANGSGHPLSEVQSLLDRFEMARNLMKELGSATGMLGRLGAAGGLGGFGGLGGAMGGGGVGKLSRSQRKRLRSMGVNPDSLGEEAQERKELTSNERKQLRAERKRKRANRKKARR